MGSFTTSLQERNKTKLEKINKETNGNNCERIIIKKKSKFIFDRYTYEYHNLL